MHRGYPIIYAIASSVLRFRLPHYHFVPLTDSGIDDTRLWNGLPSTCSTTTGSNICSSRLPLFGGIYPGENRCRELPNKPNLPVKHERAACSACENQWIPCLPELEAERCGLKLFASASTRSNSIV